MTPTTTCREHGFPARRTVRRKKITSFGHEAEKFKPVLHSIATNLGLDGKESKELAEYVCLSGERSFTDQKENFTFKIWLAKILVRNCIFKICTALFSQHANTGNFFPTSIYASTLSEIPISFRTVYVLIHCIEFTEPEVAQILNINTMQVRERLAKANAIIKGSHH